MAGGPGGVNPGSEGGAPGRPFRITARFVYAVPDNVKALEHGGESYLLLRSVAHTNALAEKRLNV